MKKYPILLQSISIFFIFYPSLLFSDQAAWNTPEQGERLLKLIRIGDQVRHYCKPCGDESFTSEIITRIQKTIPEKGYVEIYINDNSVDFAYLYVLKNDKWTNAAILAGIPVEGVDEILPDSVEESTGGGESPSDEQDDNEGDGNEGNDDSDNDDAGLQDYEDNANPD